MKHNTERAVSLIQQAIREIGTDFALAGGRQLLYAAINSIVATQKKRERRDNDQKVRDKLEKDKKLTKEQARRKLAQLDAMLKEEEAKWKNESSRSGSQGS